MQQLKTYTLDLHEWHIQQSDSNNLVDVVKQVLVVVIVRKRHETTNVCHFDENVWFCLSRSTHVL